MILNEAKLNVLILAAGLGTRLRPLTNDVPKPLVHIVDKSILEIQMERTKSLGNVRFHANAHYLAEQIVQEGERLRFEKIWVEPEILGTAGPLKRIYNAGYRGGLLVMNGDAFCQFDLAKFVSNAQKSCADVALLAVDFPKVNTFRVDENSRLAGVAGRFGCDAGLPATFSGVSWYSDAALSRICDGEFDIREFWKLEISAGRKPFVDMEQLNASWIDMGSPEGLMAACDARRKELSVDSWGGGIRSVIYANVDVPSDAVIEHSVLFEGAKILPREHVVNEIRGQGFSWKV